MNGDSSVKWLVGWTLVGLAAVAIVIYSALNQRWFDFVLAVVICWMSVCLQVVCVEEIERA